MSRVMPESWPLPELNEKTRPFFTSGCIMLQICGQCGQTQHPPEDVCFACQFTEFNFAEHQGTGTIYSFTEIVYPIHPTLKAAVPYLVALVSLTDAPDVRILGNLIDISPDEVRIGLSVEAVWSEVRNEPSKDVYLLPQWRRVSKNTA